MNSTLVIMERVKCWGQLDLLCDGLIGHVQLLFEVQELSIHTLLHAADDCFVLMPCLCQAVCPLQSRHLVAQVLYRCFCTLQFFHQLHLKTNNGSSFLICSRTEACCKRKQYWTFSLQHSSFQICCLGLKIHSPVIAAENFIWQPCPQIHRQNTIMHKQCWVVTGNCNQIHSVNHCI